MFARSRCERRQAAERGEAYKAREAVVRTGAGSAMEMSPAISRLWQTTRSMGQCSISVLDTLDLKVSHETERQAATIKGLHTVPPRHR